MSKRDARWEARRAKWEARRARAENRRAQGQWWDDGRGRRRSPRHHQLQGVMHGVIALILVGLVLDGRPWWMLFIALGLGSSALRHLAAAAEPPAAEAERDAEGQTQQASHAAQSQQAGQTQTQQTQSQQTQTRQAAHVESAPTEASRAAAAQGAVPPHSHAPAPVRAPAEPPPGAEVDALCERLLADLRSGPALLREVVQRPEEAVRALRDNYRALAARERELQRLNPPSERERLGRERAALAARVEAEGDAVTRERLAGALQALDAQVRQREEMATAAARLSAEQTRLRYVLESLQAQVLRVRAASGGGAEAEVGGLLRASVEQLQVEMEAVTEALESTAAGTGRTPERVDPVEGAPGDGTPSGRGRVRGG